MRPTWNISHWSTRERPFASGDGAQPPTAPPIAAWTLSAPALGPWRSGNTGTDGVWSFAAAEPGPHVLVTSLIHGNELCGAWAVLGAPESGLRPQRGTL